MRLFEITPQSFRNLSPEPVFFGAGVTLIAGENAQGKTNLLEAVAILCGQRSFRRAKPAEIASGGERFAVSGRLRRGEDDETLRVTWTREEGRSFFRGEKAATFAEIGRLAPAVFLAPEHREILSGAPSLRRRFLDRLVLGSRPAAADDLLRYERALKERNALLGRFSVSASAAGELEAWTEELIRAGSAVRRHRALALADWVGHFEPLAREAGPEYSAVSVSYLGDVARQGSQNGSLEEPKESRDPKESKDDEERLRREFARVAPVERRRGHTMAGPHRDDLVFSRGGRALAASASAGEVHRMVSLIKLAEWQAVRDATGALPLFGVDEFEAGLSPAWADAFLAALPEGATVLLTSAGDPARWKRRVAGVLEMREGRIVGRPRAVNAG